MAKNATQTLFRFAQLATPQKVSDENKKTYFIYHPDGVTSPFFDAIGGVVDPGDQAKKALDAAESFTGFKDLEALKALKTDLYGFAVWLASNASLLTKDTVDDKIGALSPLVTAEKEQVWDNLFKECILRQDPYLRDGCMELLVADHFLEKYSAIEKDDKTLRKLASSTLVLPKELFDRKKPLRTNEEFDSTLSVRINRPALQRHMLLAENKLKASILSRAAGELTELESTYHRTNATAYSTALGAWKIDNSPAQALAAMASQPISDPIQAQGTSPASTTGPSAAATTSQGTGTSLDLGSTTASGPGSATSGPVNVAANNSFQELLGTEVESIPSEQFNFSPAPQIGLAELQSGLSPESMQALSSNDLTSKTTFSQVQEGILELNKAEMKARFDATEFYAATIDVMGVPVLSDGQQMGADFSFYVKAYKKSSRNYALLLVVNTAHLGDDVVAIEYEANIPPAQSFSHFEKATSNDFLSIDLTPGTGLAIADNKQSLELKGSISFSDGSVLSWDERLDMRAGIFGIMKLKNGQEDGMGIQAPSGFGITRLGIAEYRKVERQLCCYVPGEVSHIENVMAREYKERSTKRVRKSDISTTSTEESEQETLTDTSTTSRFDMQKEISEVLSEQKQFGMHANLGVRTGNEKAPYQVSLDVGANYSQNKSKEKSKSEAVNMSKDITHKATDRLTTKVKRERTKRIVEEFEEQNRHGFDNRKGDSHVSGVFRWVDKIFKNSIYNYGKRLTYEFQIPEPARLHQLAKKSSAKQGKVLIAMPKNPKEDDFGNLASLKSPSDIAESNYLFWAAEYGAEEVQAPPARTQVVGKSVSKSQQQGDKGYLNNKAFADQIVIPSGYGVERVYVSCAASSGVKKVPITETTFHTLYGVTRRFYYEEEGYGNVMVTVADSAKHYYDFPVKKDLFLEDTDQSNIDKYSEAVPFSVGFEFIWIGQVTLSLELIRKKEHFEAWQLETFNAIMDAFNTRMKDYQDALAQAEAKQGIEMGTNPAFYREIIQVVLKKNCIAYLIGDNNLGQGFILSEGVMRSMRVRNTLEMDRYGAMVKFIEQAFEWDIMSYIFYPFYWASKKRWTSLYNYENKDELFKKFIQSGMELLPFVGQ